MNLFVEPTEKAASLLAARWIAQAIRINPRLVIGCASGQTPIVLYQELARLHREENLDFSQTTMFVLDEFVGLPRNHPELFQSFLSKHFFSKINVKLTHIHVPDVFSSDLIQACSDYEKKLSEAGGMDIQILGLGKNGHIGFNEPLTEFSETTHVQLLTDATRKDHVQHFQNMENVPQKAITLGIGSILAAREIILLAFGRAKAAVIQKMIHDPISTALPCSALQLHPNTKIILDFDAMGTTS